MYHTPVDEHLCMCVACVYVSMCVACVYVSMCECYICVIAGALRAAHKLLVIVVHIQCMCVLLPSLSVCTVLHVVCGEVVRIKTGETTGNSADTYEGVEIQF